MKPVLKSMAQFMAIAAVTALIAAGSLFITHDQTEAQIKANEKGFLLQKINKIIPANWYDNNPAEDTVLIKADPLLGTSESTQAHIARKSGQVIAVFFNVIATDGYNGDVHLLVVVKADQSIAGVRVVKHKETAGLADGIEEQKSDWIFGFDRKQISNRWAVKKDGGEFDQLTGATITPRAIVKAVKKTLQYSIKHTELFEL